MKILNLSEPNNTASRNIKQKLAKLEDKIINSPSCLTTLCVTQIYH